MTKHTSINVYNFCVGNLTGEDEQGDFYKIVVFMNWGLKEFTSIVIEVCPEKN